MSTSTGRVSIRFERRNDLLTAALARFARINANNRDIFGLQFAAMDAVGAGSAMNGWLVFRDVVFEFSVPVPPPLKDPATGKPDWEHETAEARDRRIQVAWDDYWGAILDMPGSTRDYELAKEILYVMRRRVICGTVQC